MNGFKRCAVVDIVPTGSYQATLTQISLYRIGFKGFPFGTFGFEQVVLCPCVAPLPCPFLLLESVVLAGSRRYSLVTKQMECAHRVHGTVFAPLPGQGK